MVIVLICNAMKLGCFVCILRMQHSPLITVGDAIESFLSCPDHATNVFAPLTIRDVRKGGWGATTLKKVSAGPHPEASIETNIWKWQDTTKRNFSFRSASVSRWTITISCCAVLLGVSLFLVEYSTTNEGNVANPADYQWTLGPTAKTTSGYIELMVLVDCQDRWLPTCRNLSSAVFM